MRAKRLRLAAKPEAGPDPGAPGSGPAQNVLDVAFQPRLRPFGPAALASNFSLSLATSGLFG
ncbi:MAG TPA: hypothetical protein VM219_01800 [Phycisphaerae bacterium]|nr:hypothetical protein [Phycisphaerae bacterium]